MTAVQIVIMCALLMLGAMPSTATPPHFEIIIENAEIDIGFLEFAKIGVDDCGNDIKAEVIYSRPINQT